MRPLGFECSSRQFLNMLTVRKLEARVANVMRSRNSRPARRAGPFPVFFSVRVLMMDEVVLGAKLGGG